MLNHEQKIERLRVGTEMSFSQANSLLNVLEGDDYTLEALTARTECLVNCRDDRVRKHAKKALSDLTDLALLLGYFIGNSDFFMKSSYRYCYFIVQISLFIILNKYLLNLIRILHKK